MIELHRRPGDTYGDEIEERFTDLVIAYRTVEYQPGDEPAPETDLSLPFIRENGEDYVEKPDIERFMEQLEKELNEQRMITGDSCYIDPETGEVC